MQVNSPASPLSRGLRFAVTALGAYALLGGSIAFSGYVLNIRRLTDWFNDGVSIQPNACVLMALTGIALLLLANGARRTAIALGSFVTLAGALTLLQYVLRTDFGFNDLLLLGRTWGQGTTVTPGRVGPPASTSFTLLGLGLVFAGWRSQGPRKVEVRRYGPICALIVCVIMAFSLFGYIHGAREFYSIPWLTAIALPTSTMLLALATGVILSVPEHHPLLLFRENTSAATISRTVMPIVVIMAPAVIWVRSIGQERGFYDAGTSRAIGSLAMVLGTIALLWIALMALRRRELRERETTRRLEGVLGSITDAFYTLDQDWRYTYVNDQLLQRTGRTREQLIGGRLWDLFPETVGTIAHEQLHKAMRDRVPVEYEIYFPPFEGWFLGKAYPTSDGGLAIYSRDITARREAEEALRASEKRYRAIVEGQSELVCRFKSDGTILFVNGAYARSLGKDPEELIGTNFWGSVGEQDRAHVRALLDQLTPEAPEVQIENRFETSDGVLWTLWTNRALKFDEQGRVIEVQSTGIDITERKKAEEATATSEERFRTLVSVITDVPWTTDASGAFIEYQPAWGAYTGQSLDQMRAFGWFGAIHPEDREAVLDLWRKVCESREIFQTEGRIWHHATQQYRFFRARAIPLVSSDGTVTEWVGACTDIHEEKQAEIELENRVRERTSQLQAANAEMEGFTYSVSHDLRTPLRAIVSASRVLVEDHSAEISQSARKLLDRQVTNAKKMAQLIDDLLRFSRLGRQHLRLNDVDLSAMALEVSNEIAGPERICVEPGIWVRADAQLLHLALHNLLSNAVKFSPEGDPIEVGSLRQGEELAVYVRDRGIGFDEQYKHKLFLPFERLHRDDEFPGTGIGLANVKRIIERHGGRVWAESAGLGHGATFFVTLPEAAASANEGVRRQKETSAEQELTTR